MGRREDRRLDLENKKALDKAEKQSFKKVIKNSFLTLKYVQRKSPFYVPILLSMGIITAVQGFFFYNYAIMQLTQAVEDGRPFNDILPFVLFLLLCQIVWYIIVALVWNFVFALANEKLDKEVKQELFKKAKEMDLSCYDDPEFYDEFIFSLNNSLAQIRRTVDIYKELVNAITQLLLGGAMFILYDVWGLLFATVSAVASIFVILKRNKLSFKLEKENTPHIKQRDYVKRLFFLNDYAKDLRVYDIKDRFTDTYQSANTEIVKNIKRYSKPMIILNVLAYVVFRYLIVDFFYLGFLMYRVFSLKTIAFATALALVRTAGWTFSSGIRTLFLSVPQLSGTSLYFEKFNRFLHTPNTLKDSGTREFPSYPSEIKLTDVCFSYGNADSDDGSSFVLKNVNMTIKPREKVAIVGFNGAGKTTLTKLLMRLYDPTSGKIEIDGYDIKEYSLSSLRQGIGVLFQDFQIFSASIKENIVMDSGGDDERIKNAIIRSGLDEKYQTFKKSLDTQLTKEFDNDGEVLSGGENQKLAMARLLYKNSPIAILDEPSSALDPKAEYNVNKIMLDESKNKTVVFISHRLSTAKIADKVYFFENGEIIESGTHASLMSLGKTYARLYSLQSKKYKFESL